MKIKLYFSLAIFLVANVVLTQTKQSITTKLEELSNNHFRITSSTSLSENNKFEIKSSESTIQILDNGVLLNTLESDSSLPYRFEFFGGGGDDFLSIDLADSSIPIYIKFDGQNNLTGTIGDALKISNGYAQNAVYHYYNESDGLIEFGNAQIEYLGLEPIDGGDAANSTFNLPTGVDNIDAVLGKNPMMSGQIEITGSTFEDTTIPNPTVSLTLNGGSMDDVVTVNDLGNLPTDVTICLDGGGGTDELIIDALGKRYIDNGSSIYLDGSFTFNYKNFETVTLINEPNCRCLNDQDVNGNNGTFYSVITVTGIGEAPLPATHTWTTTNAPNFYTASSEGIEEASPGPQGALISPPELLSYCTPGSGACIIYDNVTTGTQITALEGSYYILGLHLNNVTYTLDIEGPFESGNASNFMGSISRTCSYPNPSIQNLPASIDVSDSPVTFQVTSTTPGTGTFNGDATFNPSNNPNIYTYSPVTGLMDNNNGTATFNPAVAGVGTHTISYTFKDVFGCFAAVEQQIIVTGPEIELTDSDGDLITDGDGIAEASMTNSTDFGDVCISTSTLNVTYTITNTGTAAMTITAPELSGSSDFSITTGVTGTTIPPDGSTTFTVTFDPSSVGMKTATISIANNDSNENPFDFVIKGNGDQATISIAISGNDAEAENSGNTISYVFTRTGCTTTALTVGFSISGTATNSGVGDDYNISFTGIGASGIYTEGNSTGTITIGAGQTAATLVVTPISDGTTEVNETVIVSITQ